MHDGDIDNIFLKVHQVIAATGRLLSMFVNNAAPHALSSEVFAAFQMVAATVPSDSDVWARVEENIIRLLRRLPTFSELTDKVSYWDCPIDAQRFRMNSTRC